MSDEKRQVVQSTIGLLQHVVRGLALFGNELSDRDLMHVAVVVNRLAGTMGDCARNVRTATEGRIEALERRAAALHVAGGHGFNPGDAVQIGGDPKPSSFWARALWFLRKDLGGPVLWVRPRKTPQRAVVKSVEGTTMTLWSTKGGDN
jgi:hypothetical protein